MYRLEIVANHSVESALNEQFAKRNVATCRTIIPTVHGEGTSGPRRGTHIWPEENVIIIIYCDTDEATTIREIVQAIKDDYPDEGIKLFEVATSVR